MYISIDRQINLINLHVFNFKRLVCISFVQSTVKKTAAEAWVCVAQK